MRKDSVTAPDSMTFADGRFIVACVDYVRALLVAAETRPRLTGESLKSIALRHVTLVAGCEFSERFDWEAIAREIL